MTVQELIDELKKQPHAADVEFYDTFGKAVVPAGHAAIPLGSASLSVKGTVRLYAEHGEEDELAS